MRFLLRKLQDRRVRSRLLRERLGEPLHLNLISAFVAVFGSLQKKIEWDLVLRPHNAFGLWEAARWARTRDGGKVVAVEFGVAAGTGLLNMAHIAQRIEKQLGVEIRVYGLDSGQGMPPARDHRDHPELYWQGNYPMNAERLRAALPDNAELILGDVSQTVDELRRRISADAPLGYVVLDLDYYWSTSEALRLFDVPAEHLLPLTHVFVDDVNLPEHNSWCGASLAIEEFNRDHELRKIERNRFLRHRRIFKRAPWIDQLHALHVLDHPKRCKVEKKDRPLLKTSNPYLD